LPFSDSYKVTSVRGSNEAGALVVSVNGCVRRGFPVLSPAPAWLSCKGWARTGPA